MWPIWGPNTTGLKYVPQPKCGLTIILRNFDQLTCLYKLQRPAGRCWISWSQGNLFQKHFCVSYFNCVMKESTRVNVHSSIIVISQDRGSIGPTAPGISDVSKLDTLQVTTTSLHRSDQTSLLPIFTVTDWLGRYLAGNAPSQCPKSLVKGKAYHFLSIRSHQYRRSAGDSRPIFHCSQFLYHVPKTFNSW
jgi:hypothetical protein